MAGLLFLTCAYCLPRPDSNGNSHLDLTMAVVNHSTLSIDRYHSDTIDVDFFQGHYYTDKAPGLSLVGIPVVAAAKAAGLSLQASSASNAHHRVVLLFLEYLEALSIVATSAIALLLMLFSFLRYLGASLVASSLTSLTIAFGSCVLPYSYSFYSHVPVAAMIFGSFAAIYVISDARPGKQSAQRLRSNRPLVCMGAGLLLGCAVMCEYPTVLLVAAVALYSLIRLRRREFALVVLGTLPGLLVVIGYDWAVFGSPISTGYGGHSVSFARQESRGFAGFSWPPSPSALYGLTISPYRGLFFLSPALLLAIPGYANMRRRLNTPALLWYS
jgi:hypothetical protein